jgi:hypothetical protein
MEDLCIIISKFSHIKKKEERERNYACQLLDGLTCSDQDENVRNHIQTHKSLQYCCDLQY